MKDVVVVGGGLAGLSAAWRLRGCDVQLLENDVRVGGRIKSERRGPYWLNWGGHVFSGPGTATDELLQETSVSAVDVPGSLTALSMNGKFISRGRLETYPLRIPMSMRSRAAIVKTGTRLAVDVARYARVVRQRPGETPAERQQRIYNFDNDRTFRDLTGPLPPDAEALFATTVTRSAGNVDQISAGSGIGYFSLVWNVGQGLGRGIVGGPSTLTESIENALGDKVTLNAKVTEVVQESDSVTVRYTQEGHEHEVKARYVVLATPATVAHRIAVNLPADLHEALKAVRYGPHVASAFLTNEKGPQRWDGLYAIACPKRSFAIALNQTSIVRGSETSRQPGGSFQTFAPAALGAALLDKSEQEIIDTHLADLDDVLGGGFANTVVEAGASRWVDGSPYCFPGRSKLQPTLMRRADRVFLAGDYLGTLYTESAISTGFSAAQEAMDRLSLEKTS